MSLIIENLTISHEGKALLPPITARIEPGEVLTLMGRSGIGKSTLLHAVLGTLAPEFTATGTIHLNGHALNSIKTSKRQIGMLFQDPLLFPHLSVGENLLFGIPPHRPDRKASAQKSLKSAGLEGFFDRDPATLSGGEAARTALMRALLAEPRALLLDEPFSKLDQEKRAEMRDFTFGEIKTRAIPAILVTHDIADAKAANGPIIRLSDKDYSSTTLK